MIKNKPDQTEMIKKRHDKTIEKIKITFPFMYFDKVKTLIKTFLYSLNLPEECFTDNVKYTIYKNKLL